MRLTQIQIQDFRAFAGTFDLPLPDGCNLLLHGENGSGKSSLSFALREFFTLNSDSKLTPSQNPIEPYRHVFPDTNPKPRPRNPRVKLTFDKTPLDRGILWEERKLHPLEVGDATNPASTTQPQRENIAAISNSSGFFDYRALLRASLTKEPDKLPEQLFDLFAETLLAGFSVVTVGGKQTVGKLWSNAKSAKPLKRHKRAIARANDTVGVFDRAFTPYLAQITDKANEFLQYFPHSRLRIVRLEYAGSSYAKASLSLTGKAIVPEIEFNGTKVALYQEFLNEARLTALALSVFLAAVVLSDGDPANPDPLRLLVLDDVLIGLDLNNRLPLLELLRIEFPRHQILLLTHDLVWFEIAREHTSEWGTCKWNHARLFEEPTGPSEPYMPRFNRINPATDDVKIAEGYLRVGDLRAAAVYVRAAYETTLKSLCKTMSLQVAYQPNPRDIDADTLWRTILRKHAAMKETGKAFLNPGLIPLLSAVRSQVLNRLSHSGASTLTPTELQTALKTIAQLRSDLSSNPRRIPFTP